MINEKTETGLTYKDYLDMDDDKRYELVEGELIEMSPSPNFRHQKILMSLFNTAYNFVMNKKLGEVIISPMDIILDDNLVLQPDLMFISNSNKDIIKDRIYGSPDMVVEIISPSSFSMDTHRKFKLYEKYMINEYWIIAPAEKTVEVFVLDDNGIYQLYDEAVETGEIKSKVIVGLVINLKNIFEE